MWSGIIGCENSIEEGSSACHICPFRCKQSLISFPHESIQFMQNHGGPSTAPSFHRRLFFIIKSSDGRPVIWGFLSKMQIWLQPLILSLLFLAWGVHKGFLEQYLQSLCVSLMRHVFILTSTPCGNLRPNVNSSAAKLRVGKKSVLYVRDYYKLQIISYNWVNIAGYILKKICFIWK